MIKYLHKQIKYLNSITNIRNAVYYVKMAFIQAPVEAALALFCLESFLIYTNGNINVQQIILLILIPIIGSFIVCFLYTVFIIIFFFKNIISCYKKNILDKPKVNYEAVDSHFKKTFLIIHSIGAICYILCSSLIPQFYAFIGELKVLQIHNSPMMFIIFGVVTGCAWNISGFFGDGRIDWSNIYKDLHSKAYSIEKVKKQKFRNYILYFAIQLIILIILIGYFFFITFNINPQYIKDIDIFSGNVLAFSFFVIAFIFAITTYIKIIYNLHFKHEFSNESEGKSEIQFYAGIKELIS